MRGNTPPRLARCAKIRYAAQMKNIRCYIVEQGVFVLQLPKGARLLGVHVVDTGSPIGPWGLSQVPVLAALYDVAAPMEPRVFIVAFPDSELPDEMDRCQFVGAFQLGAITGFLFDAGAPAEEAASE